MPFIPAGPPLQLESLLGRVISAGASRYGGGLLRQIAGARGRFNSYWNTRSGPGNRAIRRDIRRRLGPSRGIRFSNLSTSYRPHLHRSRRRLHRHRPRPRRRRFVRGGGRAKRRYRRRRY